MKVWLTHEKTTISNDEVKLWFNKPQKFYDEFLQKECWGNLHSTCTVCTLEDVNYLVTEENSPLEMDIPFLQRFVVDKSKLMQQNIL